MKSIYGLTSVVLLAIILSGCSMSRSLRVEDGQRRFMGFYTIDGNIDIGANATIGNGKTIDGRITAKENAVTGTLASIDGDIDLDRSVTVNGSVKTVDGSIHVAENCLVKRTIRTFEGNISILKSVVHGDVKIGNGEIKISNTEIRGSVFAMKPLGDKQVLRARIVIGPNSIVEKIVVKNSPENVRIQIHETAIVRSIEGFEGHEPSWGSLAY